MITPDALLDGARYKDIDLVTVTPTTLSARVDGRLVEVDLEAKPELLAEVRAAVTPGTKRLRIAQASLESVRAAELDPGRTEAWLVVADPVIAAPVPLVAPMALITGRYAAGLTSDEIAAWPNLAAIIDEATGDGGQSSSRNGATVNAFQIHHSTMASAAAYVRLVQQQLRQVSSNLAIDVDGRIIRVVNLNRRAWTSGSASFDSRAITVETANSTIGDASGWRVSEASKAALGRVAAAIKADRAIAALTATNVYQHKEMQPLFQVSYATSCSWDISSPDIRARADRSPLTSISTPEGGAMYPVKIAENGDHYIVTPLTFRKINATAANGFAQITGQPIRTLGFGFFWAAVQELHESVRQSPAVADDDYAKLAAEVATHLK